MENGLASHKRHDMTGPLMACICFALNDKLGVARGWLVTEGLGSWDICCERHTPLARMPSRNCSRLSLRWSAILKQCMSTSSTLLLKLLSRPSVVYGTMTKLNATATCIPTNHMPGCRQNSIGRPPAGLLQVGHRTEHGLQLGSPVPR